MKNTIFSNKGLTLIELLLVIGLGAILLSFVTINLVKVQHNTNLTTASETLVADLKGQQVKAMSGATTSGAPDTYGVHFDSNQYVLFHGTTYNAADTTNFPVTLDGISFSSTFINSNVFFSQRSGDIPSFDPTKNTITVINTAGNEKLKATINKFGVVTSVN